MTKGWVCRKTYANTLDHKADKPDGILKIPAVQNTHFIMPRYEIFDDIKSTYKSLIFFIYV